MSRWISILRPYLPRRRRRVWQYVSGRRHGVGLVALVLLVLAAYGYWYLTNDARIEAQVERYLGDLTGGKVRAGRVHFSVFGEIRIERLRVYLNDGVNVPFFEAKTVLLQYRPGSLLGGRLEPTEISCDQPYVRLMRDMQTDRWNAQQMFGMAQSGPSPNNRDKLPPVRLRNVRLEIADVENQHPLPVGTTTLTVALLPEPDKRVYRLSYQDETDPVRGIRGDGMIDMNTGDFRISGGLNLAALDKALPRKYVAWKNRYKLAGQLDLDLNFHPGDPANENGWRQQDKLTFNLIDVSMELPPEEGGLKLQSVAGKLMFDSEGVHIVDKLTGQIAPAGIPFTLTGQYRGYEPTSPFDLSLTVDEARLPLPDELVSVWGKEMAKFNTQIAPTGPVSLAMDIGRDDQGHFKLRGQGRLKGVSLRVPGWPIPLTDVTGQLLLREDRVDLVDIRGRHGQSPIEVSGSLTGNPLGTGYDLRVAAKDVPFSPEIRQGLAPDVAAMWDSFAPRGQTNLTLNISSTNPQGTRAVLDLGGKASFEFASFPYRLDALEGQLSFGPEGAVLRGIRGRSGPMRCAVDGVIRDWSADGDYDLAFQATDLPLDERFAQALWPEARQGYRSCGFAGQCDINRATVTRRKGHDMQLSVQMALKDATVRYEGFPYVLEHASGTLRLTQDELTVERVVGRHGPARVNVKGRIAVLRPGQPVDLTVEGAGVELEPALRDLLPAGAQAVWDVLAPSGSADVLLTLNTGLAPPRPEAADAGAASQPATVRAVAATVPATTATTAPAASAPAKLGTPDAPEFCLTVRPRDASIRYRHFPAPLHGLNGTIVIDPEQVRLDAVTMLLGDAKVYIQGVIDTRPGHERADATLKTDPVVLDAALIQALPCQMVAGLGLEPGGKAALALDSVTISHPPATQPASGPASAPASAPATASAPACPPANQLPFAWNWKGRITLDKVAMGLGVGAKRFSGVLDGEMGCAGAIENLAAQATMKMTEMELGNYHLENLACRIGKSNRSPLLRVDEMTAEAYGGKLAGLLELRLGLPMKYNLGLSVDGIDLATVLAASKGQGAGEREVQGVLTGELQMTATLGDDASRKATGRMTISRAKLRSLPVMPGLAGAFYLQLPGEGAFHAADVSYYLRGQSLSFGEIYLLGQNIGLVGSGKMDLKTGRLDLTFLSGPSPKLPRLEALSEMIQGLSAELMTIRVTGTLDKPHMTTTPLRGLQETLRELLSPER